MNVYVYAYLITKDANMLCMLFQQKSSSRKKSGSGIWCSSPRRLVAFMLSPKDKVLQEVMEIMNFKG